MASEAGALHTFLANCFLLQEADNSNDKNKQNNNKTKGNTKSNNTATTEPVGLSSRQISKKPCTREQWLRSLHPVRTAKSEEPPQLPWIQLPLSGTRERNQARLRKQAVEEILMAMPRKPRPMYVGEVGNLIGKWLHFNARFDGALGGSLMEFLLQHPDSFKVLDNLVTRRTAGTAEQVKMRFDDDSGDERDDDSDSDRESRQRKARDRLLLTGAKGKKGEKADKDIPARARKKAMIKAFNKANFNRNYKPIDPSAKVPGYVKHAPRKVKGRGRKVNKRNTKRG